MKNRTETILETTLALVKEAIALQIEDVENAAAEAASENDDDKPPVAKIGISIKWNAGQEAPNIVVKSAFSVARSFSCEAVADGKQIQIPFADGKE